MGNYVFGGWNEIESVRHTENRVREENYMCKNARCNQCGKTLKQERDVITEGALQLEFTWGYFSEKDGEKHKFILCESCYDTWIKGFAVPVEITDMLELL